MYLSDDNKLAVKFFELTWTPSPGVKDMFEDLTHGT